MLRHFCVHDALAVMIMTTCKLVYEKKKARATRLQPPDAVFRANICFITLMSARVCVHVLFTRLKLLNSFQCVSILARS
jgi:hypothetical protein